VSSSDTPTPVHYQCDDRVFVDVWQHFDREHRYSTATTQADDTHITRLAISNAHIQVRINVL